MTGLLLIMILILLFRKNDDPYDVKSELKNRIRKRMNKKG